MPRTVSVIMPAYNEGWCIYENIRTTRAVLEDAGITAEIVAVDDGSRDNTRAEIERAAAEFGNVVAARNPYNMGKGMALRTGFECSSGEIIAFLDADLDLHPSQIRRLIETLDEQDVDIVTGSKHHPESKLDYPTSRKIASWGYYFIIKTLFNLPARDTQTGLKVFRRTVLDRVFHRLLVKKFAYDIELLAVAVRFGFRVREVPVVLDFKRQLRWGRLKFSDVLHMFVDTLAIFYRLRILRYYDMERPPLPEKRSRVLAVVTGGLPTPDIMARFEYEGITRIACLAETPAVSGESGDIPVFSRRDELHEWISGQSSKIDTVAFIGADCLPIGSWVRGAERNFADPGVDAVCGPVVPGPLSSTGEELAGMVFSSILSRGTGLYLATYRRVRPVHTGLAANLFLRSSLFAGTSPDNAGYTFDREHIHDTDHQNRLRYDPDIAVSRRIPPFTGPYLKAAAARAYGDGRRIREFRTPDRPLRAGTPFAVMLVLAAGWMFVPSAVYLGIAALYAAAVIWEGASYFSPALAVPAMLGIVAEHIVRAAAFPAGVIAGLLGKR